ncbi:Amino acid transporter, transmembrane domain [Dillenia turbinata]|uniref:Amino acid transporter, transmembrane domain n=1 Tax=Dillenia turbinata TaxID=194707 RepID=A0AAN8Z4Q8_9MAGN
MEREGRSMSNMEAALSVELSPVMEGQLGEYGPTPTSAHTIDHDSWQQVGLMLITSFNCGWILSFSNLMLVPLGWAWGVLCLCIVGLITAYANWLLAGFHFINGQRFIRYRDLIGFLYGRKMYYITWVSQYLILVLGNMGFILLGGKALKEINSAFSDSPIRLQYFIIITGATYFLFAFFVPTLSAMRNWLIISAVVTFGYIIVLVVVLVKDGKSNTSRDYQISGNTVEKIFNGFGAISAIIVCNTSGLLLEIQSTLRKPAVTNMRKALGMQYTIGLVSYYGVSVLGYWAYGSMVSDYLPRNLSGPEWAKVLINATVFLQSVVSQHMFVVPVHETLDTKFLKLNEGTYSVENCKRRLVLRAALFSLNTVITAAFPFMGDFINFLGSFALIPITFVFPSAIYLKVKGKGTRIEQKMWHMTIIVVFSILAVLTTISAVRLIVDNVKTYHFFADT